MKILLSQEVTKTEFIDFWSNQYNYDNGFLYDDNIGKELTEERILKLFQWKNGTPLSANKLESVYQNYLFDNTVYPDKPSIDFIRTELQKPGGTIWRIFWIHCHYPKQFPIYDQHVHRAMAHLQNWDDVEIPNSNIKKIDLYLTKYLDFYNKFEGISHKKIDEALWAYGKFVKADYSML